MTDLSLLPVLGLLGPTAAGKTAIAISLIEKYPLEIISVDSAQVYRQMNVGTAKPDAAELQRAPHALINMVEPWESYSVARFIADANTEIARIHKAKKIPLLAGGTMLYFRSLRDGLSELPQSDPDIRRQLIEYAQSHGQEALHQRLAGVDAKSAGRIHPNDPQRIMRALEVYEATGKPLSSLQNQRQPAVRYNFKNIGLFPEDRKLLHTRIAQRFDVMLQNNFEAEVAALMKLPLMHSDLSSMRSVGYRQMWLHLEGAIDQLQMKDQSVAATRQLAKRQLTWLRSMSDCDMLDPFAGSATVGNDPLSEKYTDLSRWIEAGLETLDKPASLHPYTVRNSE